MQYLTDWTLMRGNVSTDLTDRPLPVGALFDNTTVTGSWIDVQDMKNNSNIFNRMVNNVSLAMPHSGVFAAAVNPVNQILQPQDLDVSRMRLLSKGYADEFFRVLGNTTSKLR